MPDKSQLRIGNAHFRGPTGRVARDLALPHAIPAVIVPFIIEERTVIQRPGSTHAEIETAALVVIRIDVDLETIGIRALIAPGQPGDDGIGVCVIQARADIQRGIVVGEVDHGTLSGDGAFGGIALYKTRDALRR